MSTPYIDGSTLRENKRVSPVLFMETISDAQKGALAATGATKITLIGGANVMLFTRPPLQIALLKRTPMVVATIVTLETVASVAATSTPTDGNGNARGQKGKSCTPMTEMLEARIAMAVHAFETISCVC